MDRFAEYSNAPIIWQAGGSAHTVPFYQALSSITASGKTVVLADAVSNIAATLATKPVVLWLSKGKVVVDQTWTNLMPSGKYHHLLGDVEVRGLSEFDPDELREATKPIVYFATVGTFNQRDRESGTLLVHRCDIDTQDTSTWVALRDRRDDAGLRRPLIVVYDEAHNLTDQQTDLLMELSPNAFFLASATMSLPRRLNEEVGRLKTLGGYDDERLITLIDPKAVADSGLVKNRLVIGGYRAPMEETLASLLTDMREAEDDARKYNLGGLPKAIYVSNTNIVSGNAFAKDNPQQPFAQRQAPPILIWQFLVANGVDPDEIAIYCTLAFKKDFPPPPNFHLFKGGDKDYQRFTAGPFRHVIFNMSLQEGWDDPLAYFAYVDKSMESRVAVEQIVGRLLRQPHARRSPSKLLNTASFYIRVDKAEIFSSVVDEVERKLRVDAPMVKVIRTVGVKGKPVEYPPKQDLEVPATALQSSGAVTPVGNILEKLNDYRGDSGANTRGMGSRTLVSRELGGDKETLQDWESFAQADKVLARWVFQREVRRRYALALGVAPTSDVRFDAAVGVGSRAYAHIVDNAAAVVDTYLRNVSIGQRKWDPYKVGADMSVPEQVVEFDNSLHAGYDDLNSLEEDFCRALDRTGLTWARNPPRSGYGIPLASLGATANFYPDFLVWRGPDVFALDTKGGHILPEAATRKLLRIEPPPGSNSRLVVCLVSPGEWTTNLELETNDGFTVWGLAPDSSRRATHVPDMDAAVAMALTH